MSDFHAPSPLRPRGSLCASLLQFLLGAILASGVTLVFFFLLFRGGNPTREKARVLFGVSHLAGCFVLALLEVLRRGEKQLSTVVSGLVGYLLTAVSLYASLLGL